MDTDSPPSTTRKRPRENETPSQRLKREKAAERQRRKRERDRQASGLGPLPSHSHSPHSHSQQQQHQHHQQQQQQMQQQQQGQGQFPAPPPDYGGYLSASASSTGNAVGGVAGGGGGGSGGGNDESSLSPDEQARRERVRAAARERQRKHRQLVKQRKMRELGLDMGNEVLGPGLDEVHYRVNAEGQYQQVMAHEMQAAQAHQQQVQHHLQAQAAAAAHAQAQVQQTQGGPGQGEPPFPQGPAHGGQTFATTLLLSFSCAPLLKQHLLRTLNMTNDELASLEPIIAEAWDRWDQGRRIRYDQEQGFPAGGMAVPVPGGTPYPPYAPPPGAGAGDDFRGRFQRVLAVPAQFRTGVNGNGEGGATTPSSSGSVNGGVEAIDPHLGGGKDGEPKSEA
ncbi:hypothetical protein C8R44DRAFT_737237 [Mycena epipterygia]|nr:hypothetical protein C8R44DRAFT_737237 [Mycena epipterygia]